MTCDITLYEIPFLKEEKNFAFTKAGLLPIDYKNIFPFLNKYSTSSNVVSQFQFQRPELTKKIKVNISQINCLDYSTAKKYTYLVVAYPKPSPATGNIYYCYYIIGYRQVAMSTIEYELKMDVLNTFNYVKNKTNNFEYSLSERTLINRQHKDRVDSTQIDTKIIGVDYSSLFPENFPLNKWLFFDLQIVEQNEGVHTYRFGSGVDETSTSFKIRITNMSDEVVEVELLNFLEFDLDYDQGVLYLDINWNGGGYGNYLSQYKSIEIYFEHLSDFPKDFYQLKDLFYDYYIYYNVNTYKRIIDKYSESIEAFLFNINEEILLDNDGLNTWYIAYSSANAVVSDPSTSTESKYINPVHVAFYSDNGYSTTIHGSSSVTLRTSDLPNRKSMGEFLILDLRELENSGYVRIGNTILDSNGYVVGGDTFYLIGLYKKNDTDINFKAIYYLRTQNPWLYSGKIAENVEEVECFGLDHGYLYYTLETIYTSVYEGEFYIGSGSSTDEFVSDPIINVDLTEPKLIKIINFPYAPRSDLLNIDSVPTGMTWNGTSKAFELIKAQENNFNRDIEFSPSKTPFDDLLVNVDDFTLTNPYLLPRNMIYESKLFHSDFYYNKFVYDSFGFPFRLEDMDVNFYADNYRGNKFIVNYVCSSNVNSKFVFRFPQYVCSRKTQDYNDVLVVERNNEIALYNNAYINYIKSGGFAYDTKNADTKKLTNAITIALSTIGAVGSFALSGATGGVSAAAGVGLAIGTATKTISAITSAQQSDRDIAQKLLASGQQATSVSSSEDISILKSYSSNKAKLVTYRASDYLMNAVWDLFHFFGYKCHEYEIPNINTRCHFNFISADIVFKDHSLPEDIANEIREKWSQGITFFHPQLVDGVLSWDINQEYENVENSLIQ